MAITWVLVAESSRAKIFEAGGPRDPLVEREVLAHPAARQHEQNITSDLPGRAQDTTGGQRHRLEEPTSPKQHEVQMFSRELARRLEEAFADKAFQQLVLVAPPAFLGLLREHLSTSLCEHVVAEVAKNLVRRDAAEIRAHLPERL